MSSKEFDTKCLYTWGA